MSNVTVQEALDSIVESARLIGIKEAEKQRGNYTKDDSMFVEAMYKSISKNSNVVKAALVEIEKCEPVAYIHTATNTDKDGVEWVQLKAIDTSPQPRDWVGLSDYDIENLADRYLERVQPYSEYVASVNDLKQFAEAYYAEQLNTKG